MANTKCKVRKGMGGSRNGRNRHECTEILKSDSKKIRRRQDRKKKKKKCNL